MFLNFLQTDEEKVAFIKMAIIVAIANVEDDNEEKNEKKSESFSRNKDWKMSSFEKAIINGFMKELELSSYEISTDEFNKIIDELSQYSLNLPVFQKKNEDLKLLKNLSKMVSLGMKSEILLQNLQDQ